MILDLINYTQLADRRYIDVFLQSERSFREAEKIFSHILNSQHIWIKRIRQEEPLYDRLQLQPVSLFEDIHHNNFEDLLHIFHSRDLKEQIIYSNSSGEPSVNELSDILFHIVNHSTYHRAQVATQFRLNGISPPVTDYIRFKREGLL